MCIALASYRQNFFLSLLKTDTARKPISKGMEWRLFEPHSFFRCRDNYGNRMLS